MLLLLKALGERLPIKLTIDSFNKHFSQKNLIKITIVVFIVGR